MGLRQEVTIPCLLSVLLLFIPVSSSQSAFISSRATFYGSPDCSGTAAGACGYGEFGRELNGGNVGAVAQLYRNGSGCGACYQVRCKYPLLCSDEGTAIVVTDYGQGDRTDFILSARGFAKLARPNMAAELMAYGVIDIEFQRISCQYPGYNLMVKIKEQSKFPDYLALIFIYQAGQQDILAAEVWQDDCKEWKGMRRAYGDVWDIVYPPKGPLNLRILAAGDEGQNWVQLTGVIPSDWNAGAAYDSTIQLT